MNKTVRPYGSWPSPITAQTMTADSVHLGGPSFESGEIFWTEGRPTEGGRTVLVRQTPSGTQDVTPAGFNIRNRVHEYGGAASVMHDGAVYFQNDSDQHIYRQSLAEGEPQPVSPSISQKAELRFANGVIDEPRGRGIWVHEDHTDANSEAVNSIVAMPLDGGGLTTLVSGNDFYSAPTLSPDGKSMVWLTWNHPNMPWDGCELWLAQFEDDGSLSEPVLIAGTTEESIFQPQFSPDGTLYFVSDRSGWWNLHRYNGESVEPVAPMEAEFGKCYWAFGMSTYTITSDAEAIGQYFIEGRWQLARIGLYSGMVTDIPTGFIGFGGLHIEDGVITTVASAVDGPNALVRIDVATGETLETLASSVSSAVDKSYVSVPEHVDFPTENGLTAHGLYYAPTNPECVGPDDELPPLIVVSHGGPTGSTDAGFDMRLQYWTSRGFAVIDVNYGGSTGYGRAYRERLTDNWGIVDIDDCCNAAKHLVGQGLVDPDRLAIRGGSAGGYTTLSALAFRDTFSAGTSLYGISDLEAMAKETHKFESRYLDGLVGDYPEAMDIYLERSAIHHTDGFNCPIALLQGLEDKIVPPNQAQMIADALNAKGLPYAHVEFEGEQHGFRRAENIITAFEGELYFYGKIFGFEPAGDPQKITIHNLGE